MFIDRASLTVLYTNQHSALISNLFCVLTLHVSGCLTAHHQEATCAVWQLVLVCLNVDCLWALNYKTDY
jgi:hypothetical protein